MCSHVILFLWLLQNFFLHVHHNYSCRAFGAFVIFPVVFFSKTIFLYMTVNCLKSNSYGRVLRKDNYYSISVLNQEKRYYFCLPIYTLNINNCKRVLITSNDENKKCIECSDSFKLKNGTCSEYFEDVIEYKDNMNDQTKNTLKKNNITSKLKGVVETKCLLRTNRGCSHCSDGYYLSSEHNEVYNNFNLECLKCENVCKTCYNLTYCTSCLSSYFLNSEIKCQSLGELSEKCSVKLPTGGGCAICKNGFYKVEKDCLTCDISCDTCVNSYSCLSCSDGYFTISGESNKLCENNKTLKNCSKATTNGCIVCDDGFFIKNGRCNKCSDNCTVCSSAEICDLCVTPNYVLTNSKCLYFSSVENCIEAIDSKCVKCEGANQPSDDGENCLHNTSYGLIVGVPISISIVIIISIATFIIITYSYVLKIKQKKVSLNVCTFLMSRSNIEMYKLCDTLVANKIKLKFDLSSDSELIKVDTETRDLICIGNTSKNNMKVQFSVLEGCDCYKIRTVPSIVTLKHGEACEFEIFINPLCSCDIKDDIMVIGLELKTGTQYNERVKIETNTENTTKLNYNELEETKKIGEGSFGIVYKGNYRGNVVAIKRMKESTSDEKGKMVEFENEVSMLYKFRSEFIVHFYGAVFIPNKVCLVTEFAQFGSMQDLMKHKTNKEVDVKMRIKIMIDAAQGIYYLHENNILHRDIKPDNILVISLDLNEKVNGKLTDFGSSRNINLLMTNMTFTKGIGTPTYMAPEILMKEKYKKNAD
ncbi:protein kinase, putative, partial [Entamoeba invadens IP1]